MDFEERVAQTREMIGANSLRMMDAVDEDVFEAMADALEAAEKLKRRLREHGVHADGIASILVGGAAKLVYTDWLGDGDE